ncbi:hypothetical protein Mag101_03280 [Microbulbifer agarilyticus]|uniref:Uncharacterized protein n=1 Tax=Microbulbifer agarilyticus TaxID=260552 RepID=A0A1Q2M2J8_9GAMM|nr:hypothetical protein [Microbulbifer agarilyticus]AQQ66768.1 hypothetical protein Mag101_03280 [Microbulbifer agarilyticus]
MATAGGNISEQFTHKPFHLRRWLSAQQAVDHLNVLTEEQLTGDDLARLAEDQKLDLYWYRPGQQLKFIDKTGWSNIELSEPLRLSPTNQGDWRAIVGILRHQPALPATENDTPTLLDAEGNRLRITFGFHDRPEPFSGRWYPNYSELVVRRRDLDNLESQMLTEEGEQPLEAGLLLDVIWQLEQMAMENGQAHEHPHDLNWLTDELSDRTKLDPRLLGKVLNAAERQHATHY